MTEQQGPIIITGANRTRIAQMIAQKHAMILEGKGLKHSSGKSVTAHVKRLYGLRGSRDKVIAQFTEIIHKRSQELIAQEAESAVAPPQETK